MRQPKKLKKGEEGLKQLREFFSSSHDFYRDIKLIDDFLAEKEIPFKVFYDVYGYNLDHDYVDGKISTFKKDDLFIREDKTRFIQSDGKVEIHADYVIISKGKNGRYSIMKVVPKEIDGKKSFYVTTDFGLKTEKGLKIDLTQEIPDKVAPIFAKVDDALKIFKEAEKQYKIERDKKIAEETAKKEAEKQAAEQKAEKIDAKKQQKESKQKTTKQDKTPKQKPAEMGK